MNPITSIKLNVIVLAKLYLKFFSKMNCLKIEIEIYEIFKCLYTYYVLENLVK